MIGVNLMSERLILSIGTASVLYFVMLMLIAERMLGDIEDIDEGEKE